jgi:2-polyprenyl-6-methoxyphenol hydroxylase-like FAD-dependent oxidoreductase
MRKSLDVAIIGAGITGLASATLLARHGHRVVVHERFETSRPLGSGLMLQPTGLAALERLGLRQSIEALGARIDRLHGTTDRGTTIFDLAYGDLDPQFYAVGIHRAALHGALWSEFLKSGAALETSRTIIDIDAHADGRLSLRDEKMGSGAYYDLVVDASGARSQFRALVTRATARQFSYGAVWASVPDIGIAPEQLAQRYVGAKVMIGYLPVGVVAAGGQRLAALFWSLKPDEYPAWRANFEPWRERLIGLWPALEPIVAELKNPNDLTLASYVQYTARAPFKGAIVLIGDAAHATSPQLGQGANHGLLDALALSDAIAISDDLPAALAHYAKVRRDHVRFYQMASHVLTPFFQSDSRLLAIARDLCFDRMKTVPYLRREMLRTLAGLKTGLFTCRDPEQLAGNAGPGNSAGADPANASLA